MRLCFTVSRVSSLGTGLVWQAQVYVIAGFLEFYFAHRERED